MDKTIQVELAKIGDEIKKVVRRQDEMQRSLDLLFSDRQILEDVQGNLKHLQEIILANQQHQDQNKNDLKQEIREGNAITENKVHDIVNKIDSNTVIIKSKSIGIIDKLKKLFKGGEIIK